MSTSAGPPSQEPEFLDHEYDAERHLPEHHNPLPALSEKPHRHDPTSAEFAAVAETPEFTELRKRFRGFAFPMAAFFLIWYLAFVLLSCFAVEFMATKLVGNMTIGLVLGVLQFVTTFLITWLYIRHANKNLDPIANRLKSRLEGEVQ